MPSSTQHLSAGTQVVTLVPIPGPNKTVAHPRGAVGIITRTPTREDEPYLIHFPDGFESSLEPKEFEVLKYFKDRLPATPSECFDLEACIIYRCVTGSRAYGLETEISDTDYRGIYLAPPSLEWSLYGAPEQFEDHASQSSCWELRKFLIMALKANPNVLECLYSPLVVKTTPLTDELLALRKCFLSQMVFQTYNGYALSQFKKIEQDRRNQGEVRWKHAMHLLRLLITGAAILHEGRVPVRVEAHRERLLAVKRGDVPWNEINVWRLSLHRDFEAALVSTTLPERPDYEAANVFLLKARKMACFS